MITNVHTDGLENSQPLELLLGEQGRMSHLDVDLLVLGPLSRRRGVLLSQLRYRKERRAPYAILPEEFLLTGMLKVPYITYGFSSTAHVYPCEIGDRFVSIHTPLGELRLELLGSVEDTLAAVALGLALRLDPDTIVERLTTKVDLPLAA